MGAGAEGTGTDRTGPVVKVKVPKESGARQRKRINGYTTPPLPFSAGLAYVCKFLDGGKDQLVELAALSQHPGVLKVVELWHAAEAYDRKKMPFEYFVEAAEMQPADFLAEVVRSAFTSNMDVAHIMAMIAHPRIIAKTVELAQLPAGHRERDMLFRHSGFLPVPQGARTQINVTAQAKAESKAAATFGSFEDRVIRSASIIREVTATAEEDV